MTRGEQARIVLQFLTPKFRETETDLMDKHMRLVLEDAPKNRFSVLTGQLKMLREIEEDLKLEANRNG